jgi:hypothetical protein
MLKVEKINYQGWGNSCRLSNTAVELIITTDVGPRIIRFGFIGGDNQFHEDPRSLGQQGGDEWRLYGGHRLWHAPESQPRTYYPDNHPVSLELHGDFVRITQAPEPTTGIQKELDIYLFENQSHARIIHRLRNTNLWDVDLAPWALSVMAAGGIGILPLPLGGSHAENLTPRTTLSLWAYTAMNDPRWTWGSRYVLLRQDPTATIPQKVGAFSPDGWLAYSRNGTLFIKCYGVDRDMAYPDMGCSAEMFTNADMLEIETLGALVHLPPKATVTHIEDWFLFKDVPPIAQEADVEARVVPLVQQAKASIAD